jgi:hypothetical protein
MNTISRLSSHTKETNRHTGRVLVSLINEVKWSIKASITRNGNAYFLVSNILINKEFDPEYGISANLDYSDKCKD